MVKEILDVRDVKGHTVFDLLEMMVEEKTSKSNLMVFVGDYEMYESVIWLLDAMQIGDYEAFSKLQVEYPNILDCVCCLPLGGTPLHIAVRFGQLNDCIIEIIRKRPDFAARKDHKGRNPLHIASAKGYLEIVKELLTQIGFGQCFVSAYADEMKGGRGKISVRGTPIGFAIRRGKISVFDVLLTVWWKCVGVAVREVNSKLLYSAVEDQQFEALKMLLERYIGDELLKAKEVDGNPMSALADGYIEIVVKHLLSPKVNYNLSILVNNKHDGKTMGTEAPVHLYFAVIKVTSSSRRKDNNIVDEILLSDYYPKYFHEVTVGDQMVLHLSVDDGNAVTLKLLLRSPLFYQLNKYSRRTIFEFLENKLENEVVKNETGKLLPIWSNKINETRRPSSIEEYDDSKEQLIVDTKTGHEADGNEEQLSAPAIEEKADLRNDYVEDSIRNQDTVSLKEGQVFASFEECRDAIKYAAISGKFEVKFTRLEKRDRIVAECINTSCKWKIRAHKLQNSSNFKVTKIENEHTCPRLEESTNKLATPLWVSSCIIEKVREDHNISTQGIIEFFKSQHATDITGHVARKAKKRALSEINDPTPKKKTIHGPETVLKKRRTNLNSSSSVSSNADDQSRSNLVFLEQFPEAMHEYIHSTADVEADGHCGYRVVAMQLGYEAMHGWKRVRRELRNEVVQNVGLYVKLMDIDAVAKLEKAFAYFEDRATDRQYWLRLPEAGYVIANAYNAVVVSLSLKSGNFTFLPLLEPPPEGRPHRIITFGFVNGNHFIRVILKPDAPMPRVDRRWDNNVSKAAKVWKTPYLNRFDMFKEIMGVKLNSGQRGEEKNLIIYLDENLQSPPHGPATCHEEAASSVKSSRAEDVAARQRGVVVGESDTEGANSGGRVGADQDERIDGDDVGNNDIVVEMVRSTSANELQSFGIYRSVNTRKTERETQFPVSEISIPNVDGGGSRIGTSAIVDQVEPEASVPAVNPNAGIVFERHFKEPLPGHEIIGGFSVPAEHATLYTQVWQKYGHIATTRKVSHCPTLAKTVANLLPLVAKMDAMTLDTVTEDLLEELEGQTVVSESLEFNMGWLRQRIDSIKERRTIARVPTSDMVKQEEEVVAAEARKIQKLAQDLEMRTAALHHMREILVERQKPLLDGLF